MARFSAVAGTAASKQNYDELKQHLEQYKSNAGKASRTCLTTFGFLAVSIVSLMFYPGWLASVMVTASTVRVFILFHDLCHFALFPTRSANVLVARLCQPFLFRTMEGWMQHHNNHHKIINSDPPPHNFPLGWAAQVASRAIDDSKTVLFSMQEYESQPILTRSMWRLFREPFVFFLVLVPLQWFAWPRPQEWKAQCMHLSLAMTIYFGGGYRAIVSYYIGAWMALVVAGLMFHLQHNVNPGYWKDEAHGYTKEDAILRGTSYLRLPWLLRWVTLDVGYHHIHHVSVRVPCYALEDCHKAAPMHLLDDVTEVSMAKAFRSCFHSMWDTDMQRFVSFDVYRMLGLQD